MASLHFSDRLLQYSRFSLRSLLVALTLASLAFAGWWQRPVQIDHLPPELGQAPAKSYACAHSLYQAALWDEKPPPVPSPAIKVDPFDALDGKYVYAHSGKCRARRNGLSAWLLDGPAEIFTKEHQRIMRAEYSRGKLHGEFRSWFTTGQMRETGRYVHGEKDGVWERFEQHTGQVETHEEYDHGRKVGIWTRQQCRETYRNGKLASREYTDSYSGKRTIHDYDEQEKLRRKTFWNIEGDKQFGEDHYAAGVRHGSWFRQRMEEQKLIVQRGQWTDGLPSGEWVYEHVTGPPQRLQFRAGALIAVDGEPVCDRLLQRLTARETELLREPLLVSEHRIFANDDLLTLFEYTYGLDWPMPRIDPRLPFTEEAFAALWKQKLPENFDYENLPAAAALCLGLHHMNLTLDYRFGTFWITSPQIAANWQDETGAMPWFEKIANTPWKRAVNAEGITEIVDSPHFQRDAHSGEDWEERWQAERKLELLKPLECSLGTARRIDGTHIPRQPRLQMPAEFHKGYETHEPYLFLAEELIELECETHHCHLVLRGDTLFLEPR